MKRAYADRSKFLDDPDFAQVPVNGLMSEKYEKDLAVKINESKTTLSTDILPGKPASYESPDTTHFFIVDKQGNVINLTYTINFSFGSRIIIPELGFMRNNEMDDFSAKPRVPNAYGLIGGDAKSVQAGKIPLSSMTPVMVFKKGKPWFINGSPGGSKIINTNFKVLLNVINFKMNIAEATNAPGVHNHLLSDVLNIELGYPVDSFNLFKGFGHNVKTFGTLGCTETIMIDEGIYCSYADPRKIKGKAAGN